MRSFKRRKLVSSGQLIVMIPLSAAIIGAGVVMWYYFGQVRNQYTAQKLDVDVTSTLINIATRVRTQLTIPMQSNCFDSAVFQDFRVPADPATAPPPPSLSFDITSIPNCLLLDQEKPTFSTMNVSITRLGFPNISNLSNRVRVDIQGQMAPRPGVIAKKVSLSRSYVLRVATLNYFNIIFMKNSNTPVVNMDLAQGSIEFTGSVFFADSNPIKLKDLTPIDFTTPLNGSTDPILFDRPVFFRTTQVQQDASQSFNFQRFSGVFRQGFQTELFSRMKLMPLPFDMPSLKQAWNQVTDYTYSGENPPPPRPDGATGKGQPLPRITSPVSGSPAVAIASDDSNPTDPTLEQAFNPLRAGKPWNYTIPYSEVSTDPSFFFNPKRLEETCVGPNGNNVNPTFVFQQIDAGTPTLTIDFTGTGGANPTKGNPVFCGLVAVKELVIKTSVAGNYGLFGNFIVERITLQGPGSIFFYNPTDNITPQVTLPNLPPPTSAPQTQYGVMLAIQAQASSAGNNFFSVLLKNASQPKDTQTPFLPREPGSVVKDTYMQLCPNCSGHSVQHYCTSRAKTDYSQLFPDTSNDLIFMAEGTL